MEPEVAPPPNSAAAPAASEAAAAPPKTVAYSNFQAVVEAKTGLETQVRELQATVQKLTEKAATTDTLAAQLEEWKGKASAAEQRFGVFTEISGALGTTDAEVIGLFAARYDALPKTDRPERTAWVTALKASPDDAPALLRPWLAPAQAAAPAASAARPQPRAPGTGGGPPAAPANVTETQIRAAREKGASTGDWSEWRELSKAMGIRK